MSLFFFFFPIISHVFLTLIEKLEFSFSSLSLSLNRRLVYSLFSYSLGEQVTFPLIGHLIKIEVMCDYFLWDWPYSPFFHFSHWICEPKLSKMKGNKRQNRLLFGSKPSNFTKIAHFFFIICESNAYIFQTNELIWFNFWWNSISIVAMIEFLAMYEWYLNHLDRWWTMCKHGSIYHKLCPIQYCYHCSDEHQFWPT